MPSKPPIPHRPTGRPRDPTEFLRSFRRGIVLAFFAGQTLGVLLARWTKVGTLPLIVSGAVAAGLWLALLRKRS